MALQEGVHYPAGTVARRSAVAETPRESGLSQAADASPTTGQVGAGIHPAPSATLRTPVTRRAPYTGFVVEDHLGHATHAANLRAELARREIDASWMLLPFEVDGPARHVPGFGSNWTVRAGIRARRAIRRSHHARPLEALFVHTQVAAVLASGWFDRVPAVVSMDATPRQIDELGGHYAHATAGGRVEALKLAANRRCLHRAGRVVAWSEWAARSAIDDYGVAPEQVCVVAPGVELARWRPPAPSDEPTLRVLFVGGDLVRKGGDVLLDAVSALAAEIDVHLDLVTSDAGAEAWASRPWVTVHRGVVPNSPRLIELAHRAHVFCLPTRGDCLPIALLEAAAAGLALVSTDVAAIGEVVVDGVTGMVVPPGDAAALARALRSLADPALRRRMGSAARARAEERYDVEVNTGRLLDLLAEVSGS